MLKLILFFSKIEATKKEKVKTPITVLSPVDSDRVDMGKNRRTKEKKNSFRYLYVSFYFFFNLQQK